MMDDFFHIFSRLVFVIPITAVIIGLVAKFNQSPTVSSQISRITPTIPPVVIVSPTSALLQIDLNGPLICHFNSTTATISASIKDKKIFATIQSNKQSNNFILNGDCIYMYVLGSYSGEKICGIGTYLNFIGSIPLSMLDSSMVRNNLPMSLPININDLKNVFNSCKREPINDESIFDVPKNILFKNQ